MNSIKLMLATIIFTGTPLLFSGCSEEVLPETEAPKTTQPSMTGGVVYPNSKNFKQTRSATFETDWENFTTYTLTSGTAINLPWVPNTLGKFDYETAQDIKKADGWTMLLHTLNKKTDQKQFMIFYNKLSGQLKVFYYHNSQLIPHSNVSWNIAFEKPQGWLNSTSEIALPLGYKFTNGTEYSYESFAAGGQQNSKIEEGWHIFSVPSLAYDETFSSNQILYLSNNTLDQYIGEILGSIDGDIKGTIVTDGSTKPFSDMTKSLSNLSGDAAKKWVDKYCTKKIYHHSGRMC